MLVTLCKHFMLTDENHVACSHPDIASTGDIKRCFRCEKYNAPPTPITVNGKSRGLGDTIAKMTSAVGIRPCGGCKKRQAKLNELVPYR